MDLKLQTLIIVAVIARLLLAGVDGVLAQQPEIVDTGAASTQVQGVSHPGGLPAPPTTNRIVVTSAQSVARVAISPAPESFGPDPARRIKMTSAQSAARVVLAPRPGGPTDILEPGIRIKITSAQSAAKVVLAPRPGGPTDTLEPAMRIRVTAAAAVQRVAMVDPAASFPPDIPDKLFPVYIASGDSVAAGDDIDGLDDNKAKAYPRFFLDYLQADIDGSYNSAYLENCNPGKTGHEKYNIAHGGDTTTDYLNTQLQPLLACDPDLATVTIGANDLMGPAAACFGGPIDEVVWMIQALEAIDARLKWLGIAAASVGCLKGVFDETTTFLDIIDQNLGVIFSSIVANSDGNVLATGYYNPLPTTGFFGSAGEVIAPFLGAVNGKIQAQARASGPRVRAVDIESAFVRHGFLQGCSYIQLALPPLHPNEIGQNIIASLVGREARSAGFIPGASPSRPFVACVKPNSEEPGATVEIHGADFDSAATVTFGGQQAQVLRVWDNGTHIRVRAPTDPIGGAGSVVDVRVTNPDGATDELPEGFTFEKPPVPILKRFLSIFVNSPATLLVTDPSGRRVGFDAETGKTLNEVPNAVFLAQEGSKGVAVVITSPEQGNYEYRVQGTETGTYDLIALSTIGHVVTAQAALTGVPIADGETQTANIEVIPDLLCGDPNLDGNIDVLDVGMDLQIMVGAIEPTDIQRILGDLNSDDAVNVFDAIMGLQHIVGLIPALEDCGPVTP